MNNTFRISPSLSNYYEKSTVRIGPEQMKSLGINEGDFVKVTGTKSTGAICLPMANDNQNSSNIVYLSKSGIFPLVQVTQHVVQNIGIHPGLSLIQIEKIQSNLAQRVSLVSLNGEFDEMKLDKSKLADLVVYKQNRIYLTDANPQNNYAFLVTSVRPDTFAKITNNTKIEFQKEAPSQMLLLFHIPKLTRLKQVIPIVRQISTESLEITIPSLEIYDDGVRIYCYLKGTYPNYPEFSGGHILMKEIRLQDDMGNDYEIVSSGGAGSSSSDGFDFSWSFVGPAVFPEAKEMILTIQEIQIQEPFNCPMPVSDNTMTEFRYSKDTKLPSFLIISGPWQIKIKL